MLLKRRIWHTKIGEQQMQKYTPEQAAEMTGMELVALQLCIMEAMQRDPNFAVEMPLNIDEWEYYPDYVINVALSAQGRPQLSPNQSTNIIAAQTQTNISSASNSTNPSGSGADESTVAIFAEIIESLGIQVIATKGYQRAEIESAIEKTAYTNRKTELLATELEAIRQEYREVTAADPLRFHKILNLPDPTNLQAKITNLLEQAQTAHKESESYWKQINA